MRLLKLLLQKGSFLFKKEGRQTIDLRQNHNALNLPSKQPNMKVYWLFIKGRILIFISKTFDTCFCVFVNI